MRKGADFEIDCNSGRRRVNINAAVRAIKSEHVVCDIAESINAQFAERLYRKLLVKHPGEKIYIICANARHNRCTWLQQWAAGQRIEFAFPAGLFAQCGPLRTPVAVCAQESHYYDTYSKFRNSIIHFLENIERLPEEVRSLLTLNFRTVKHTSFHLSQATS